MLAFLRAGVVLVSQVFASGSAIGQCVPSFSQQPQGGTVQAGSYVRLSVAGTLLQDVRWYRDSVPLEDGGRFLGVQTATLSIGSITPGDGGSYTVVATTRCGSAESAPAEVRVDCTHAWSLREPRVLSQAVFVPSVGAVLMFGVQGDVATATESWLWDGTSHERLSVYGPLSLGTVGVLDQLRDVVVAVRGDTSPTLASMETWEYAGGQWTLVTRSGPPPRTDFALAYDPTSGAVLLFGGEVGGARLADMWLWDGTAWRDVTTAGPPARSAHAMSTDTTRDQIVLFGGFGDAGRLADTWVWDGAQWSQHTGSGPSARAGHAMTFDAAREVVVLANTDDITRDGDTWEWDGGAWTERDIPTPIDVTRHSMTFDPLRQRVVLVGGQQFGSPPTRVHVWEYDGISWQARALQPVTRLDHAVAFDEKRERVVRFGGVVGSDPHSDADDTWAWDGLQWSRVAVDGPARRLLPAMAYDAARERVVLFGGRWPSTSTVFADTWTWDGDRWTNAGVQGPTPRFDAAMAYDPSQQRVILFGGTTNGIDTLRDTWAWNGAEWSLLDAEGPGGLFSHGVFYDEARSRLVLHGRQAPGIGRSSTWVWSTDRWEVLVENGPDVAGRWLVYDADRGTILGPSTGNQLQAIWELRASEWFKRSDLLIPIVRGDAAYDRRRGVTVFCASPTAGFSNLVWELRAAMPADANADSRVDNADLSVLLSQFGSTVPARSGADFNADARVDADDLQVLLESFGTTCLP